MTELRDRDGLRTEPLAEHVVVREMRRQDFDRDVARERGVMRLVHRCHTTATDLLQDPIRADRRPCRERHASIPVTR